MAQPKPSRIARLLLKAVRDLPDGEQQAVLEYLFEAALLARADAAALLATITSEAAPDASPGPRERPQRPDQLGQALAFQPATISARRPGLGPGQQMVPVRLPEAQHRRLKEWCEEHNFPMAVVVRGLVERFLDDQDRRAA